MKKKYTLLLLMLITFLTGCTVDYNLIIKSDNVIEENISIYESIDIINKYYGSAELAKKDLNVSYQNYLESNKYKIRYKHDNQYLTAKLKKESSSFDKLRYTPFFQTMFGNANIEKTKDYTYFETEWFQSSSEIYNDQNASGMIANNININIQFHNEVIEANSDYYDKKTNTHTWEITKDSNDKKIYFKIGKTKRYDIIIMYLIDKYILVFSICAIVILSLFITLLTIRIRIKKINNI
ncbi:MAG TPA: hypothetical protein GX747_03040 [Tenericutes bacterium]|nr:hypothetical protein [Mycoplasmatota bacterium]